MRCLSKANAQLKFFETNVFTNCLDWVTPAPLNGVCLSNENTALGCFVLCGKQGLHLCFAFSYDIHTFLSSDRNLLLKILLKSFLAIFCSNGLEATYRRIVTKLMSGL